MESVGGGFGSAIGIRGSAMPVGLDQQRMGDRMARTVGDDTPRNASLFIHCNECNAVWEVDNDPESCTCSDDVGWSLLVVEDEP